LDPRHAALELAAQVHGGIIQALPGHRGVQVQVVAGGPTTETVIDVASEVDLERPTRDGARAVDRTRTTPGSPDARLGFPAEHVQDLAEGDPFAHGAIINARHGDLLGVGNTGNREEAPVLRDDAPR
jgi:hypothetical protein